MSKRARGVKRGVHNIAFWPIFAFQVDSEKFWHIWPLPPQALCIPACQPLVGVQFKALWSPPPPQSCLAFQHGDTHQAFICGHFFFWVPATFLLRLLVGSLVYTLATALQGIDCSIPRPMKKTATTEKTCPEVVSKCNIFVVPQYKSFCSAHYHFL
jgi:hypothetical protein